MRRVTRGYTMDIGYLLDRTPVAEQPQDEETDSTRLLRSLSSFCLGFVFTRDVVVPPHVTLPVVARTHFNNVRRCSTGRPPGLLLLGVLFLIPRLGRVKAEPGVLPLRGLSEMGAHLLF
jgi:hypothetical protein